MQSDSKQNIKKIVLSIALLLAIVAILTFLFRYIDGISNIPLKIAATYSIYLAFIALVFLFWGLEKRKPAELGFTAKKLLWQILIGVGISVALSFLIGALPILIGGSRASLNRRKSYKYSKRNIFHYN